nr:hypothetical protein CFP56_67363 [Quercus suber]
MALAMARTGESEASQLAAQCNPRPWSCHRPTAKPYQDSEHLETTNTHIVIGVSTRSYLLPRRAVNHPSEVSSGPRRIEYGSLFPSLLRHDHCFDDSEGFFNVVEDFVTR